MWIRSSSLSHHAMPLACDVKTCLGTALLRALIHTEGRGGGLIVCYYRVTLRQDATDRPHDAPRRTPLLTRCCAYSLRQPPLHKRVRIADKNTCPAHLASLS